MFLAYFFRLLFKFNFFRKRFFGIHTRIFKPYNLFKGVVCQATIYNLKLNLQIDDWIQENIFFLGEYEKAELLTLSTLLKKDDVLLDIGANIGLYSLYASKIIGDNGKIISFEPFEQNFQSFTKNISLNSFTNIQVEKKAVGAENGTINLYYNQDEKNLGMVSTQSIENSISEKVLIISIDQFLEASKTKKIDFVKIDIEGHEFKALKGMQNTLLKYKPTILIEILVENKSIDNKEFIHEFLVDLGYHKYFINDNGSISNKESNSMRRNFIYKIN